MAGLGIGAIEISSGHAYEEGLPEKLVAFEQEGRTCLLLHNFAPPVPEQLLIDLAEPDAARRQAVVDYLKACVSLTHRLGADYFSFHAGYRVPYVFGRKNYEAAQRQPVEKALNHFIAGLRPVLAHAVSLGVHLGVENHVVEPGNEENLILFDAPGFEALFTAADSPFLHLHLDTGHLNVTAATLGFDKSAFTRRFKDKILAAHVHANDGLADKHEAFDSDFWFLSELSQMVNLRYACLETATKGDMSKIRKMAELLLQAPALSGVRP